MDIRKIQKIDALIQRQQTGSPAMLAKHLQCSERMVFAYLKFMKDEMGAPIAYAREKESYRYAEDGVLGLNEFEK